MGQGAGHGHTLLLTAGEELRVDIGLILQMHQLQHVAHPLFDLFAADVGHMHGKGDVLIHRHTGDEAEILEDNAHLAAQVGDLAAAHPGHVPAVHKHLALAGHFLAENELEQGGFARAGVAQQEHELAVVHMEVNILQRQLAALFIFFGNVFKIYHEMDTPDF